MARKHSNIRVTRHALKRFRIRNAGTRADMVKSIHRARECEPWMIEKIAAKCPHSHDPNCFFCHDMGLIYVCLREANHVIVKTVLRTKDLG